VYHKNRLIRESAQTHEENTASLIEISVSQKLIATVGIYGNIHFWSFATMGYLGCLRLQFTEKVIQILFLESYSSLILLTSKFLVVINIAKKKG